MELVNMQIFTKGLHVIGYIRCSRVTDFGIIEASSYSVLPSFTVKNLQQSRFQLRIP